MRKVLTIVIAAAVATALLAARPALAKVSLDEETKAKKEDADKPVQYTKEEQKVRDAYRKTVAKSREDLNGTQWSVTLVSPDPAEKPVEDVLTFQNHQVGSKVFAARGFSTTNYTITVRDGADGAVWETMQSSPKEGNIFIRGQWKANEMTGSVIQQLEGGKTKEYYFTTSTRVAVPVRSGSSAPIQAEASETETAAPGATGVLVSGEKSAEQAPAKKKKMFGF